MKNIFSQYFAAIVGIVGLLMTLVAGVIAGYYQKSITEISIQSTQTAEAKFAPLAPIWTNTPAPTPSVTSINTPTATDTLTPINTPTATNTPTPTNTLTPTNTPTPLIPFGVITKTVTIRSGPDETASVVDFAYEGERVIISGFNNDKEWLKITIPDKSGWIRVENIYIEAKIESIQTIETSTPTPIPTLVVIGDKTDITNRSIIDKLDSNQGHVFKFDVRNSLGSNQSVDIVITLLFYSDGDTTSNNVQLAIQDKSQFQNYGHLDIDSPSKKIGIVKTDKDKDILHWRGPLAHGVEYFLSIVNRSSKPIIYCLVPSDVEDWTKCP